MIQGVKFDGETMGQADLNHGPHIVESRLKPERGLDTGAIHPRCGEGQHIVGKAPAADYSDRNRLRSAGTTT